jgi:hypothetical protein
LYDYIIIIVYHCLQKSDKNKLQMLYNTAVCNRRQLIAAEKGGDPPFSLQARKFFFPQYFFCEITLA